MEPVEKVGSPSWPRSSNWREHDEYGSEQRCRTAVRVQPDLLAPSGRCGPPPKLLDRFWTINHLASLKPANWPQRSNPLLSTTSGAERLRECFRGKVLRTEC